MPTKTKKSTRTSTVEHKRHGLHHKHSKPYRQVYWPYLPLLILAFGALLFSLLRPLNHPGVLSYATNLSANKLLEATNDQRRQNNAGNLSLNAQLNSAAQAKADDMVKRNYWSHNTPDGQEPWIFIQTANYSYEKAGENLAYGFKGNTETVAGWMNSPSHRANLLDTAFSEVGFGFANSNNYHDSGEETVVVAMYGKPASSGISLLTANTPVGDKQPSEGAPVNSSSPVVEPATASLSYAQILTAGKAPWASFAIGLTSGAIIVFLVIKYGLVLKKLIHEGEAFVLHHPLLDIALISLLILATYLTRTSGFIR